MANHAVTIPRRATYEDYLKFPEDGLRYELLDGEIFMTPAPSVPHQYTSKRVQRLLEAYFEGSRSCLVLAAPVDVILADVDVVQPDLVVVAEGPQITTRGIVGAPLILVELLSPSRPDYDRLTKSRRYAARRVPHYWIADPDQHTFECFVLEGDTYRLDAVAAGGETLAVPAFHGLVIPLGALWLAPLG